MSSGITPVTFRTVESNYAGPFSPATDEPYQRVLGLSIGNGMPENLWTPSGSGADLLDYTQSDTEERTIEIPSIIAGRLGSFFNRFYVEAPQYQLQSPESQLAEFYETNCHRFSYWMKGTPAAEGPGIPAAPDHIVSEGLRVKPPFKLGRHAVLGRHAAIHSVTGLGEDTDECLQVLASSGPMGIGRYDAILADYDPGGSRDYAYYV